MMMSFIIFFNAYLVLYLTSKVDTLDCSMYKNNEQVFNNLTSYLFINPFDHFSPDRSYVKARSNGSVSIHIVKLKKKIPDWLFCLSNVHKLEIRSSSFENSNEFGKNLLHFASTLIQLIIHETEIGSLTEEFGRMIHLRSIHLISVGLRSIPNAIRNLRSLVSVDLSRNDLTDLPNGLKTMQILTSLSVSDNPHLTSVDGINGHLFLQVLRAERCSIRSLPKNLPNLGDLYLSENQLENLGGIETIGTKSSNSKNFYFNQNKIQWIPLTIDRIGNLSRFFVNSNLLPNIPAQMLNIQSLTCISFDHNLIDAKELAQTIKAFRQKFNKSIIYSRENRC